MSRAGDKCLLMHASKLAHRSRLSPIERALASYIMNTEYGWPVLSIDRVYNNGYSGQLRTRVQAFVESLEIKKIQRERGAK